MFHQALHPAGRRRMLLIMAGLLSTGLILAACSAPSSPTSQSGTAAQAGGETTTAGSSASTATTGATTIGTSDATGQQSGTGQTYVDIAPGLVTADQALTLLDKEPGALLIDVRTEEEYRTGHIPNSILIPIDDLSSRLGELPTDKSTVLIVYCRTGRRSAAAADILREAGYTRIYDLGGIVSWPYDIEI